MHRIPRKWRIPAAITILAMALTACGSSEPGEVSAEASAIEADATTDTVDNTAKDAQTVEEVLAELGSVPYQERLQELESKAKAEGTVLMYGSASVELNEAVAQGFMEKYPEIKVEYVRVKSQDIVQRVLLESRSGRNLVDVIAINALAGASLYEEGLLADHSGAPIPDGFPEEHVEDWAATQIVVANVIAWNTNLVSDEEAPRSLDELLDPKWKGKVVIDTQPVNFVAALVADRGADGARDYIEQLVVGNEAQIRRGHTNITRLMAAGEFPVAAELFAYRVESMIVDDGAPLAWHAPKPTAGLLTNVYIPKDAPHPYAAALLMHYMLDEDGGRHGPEVVGKMSANPKVDVAYPKLKPFITEGTPEFENMLPITPSVAIEHQEVVNEIIDEFIVPRVVEDETEGGGGQG